MNTRVFQERLRRRAKRAGIAIPSLVADHLETYYRLLATWNVKINLSGMDLREPSDEAFDRLLIEPVLASRHLPPGSRSLLDVGSGGGSPAIPLKLASHAGLSLTMVESKTRKSVFLREVIRDLRLSDADVVTARFEELLARPMLHEAFDIVTVRAVRIEPKILTGLQAFLKVNGQLFLFRGHSRTDRAETVHPPLAWHATYPLVESLRSRLGVLE